MPGHYEDWKAAARAYAMAAWAKDQIAGPVMIEITLYPDHFEVEIEAAPEEVHKVRGDIDNLAGAVLDALQPKKKVINGKRKAVTPGVIVDDSQVVSLVVRKATLGEIPYVIEPPLPTKPEKKK